MVVEIQDYFGETLLTEKTNGWLSLTRALSLLN